MKKVLIATIAGIVVIAGIWLVFMSNNDDRENDSANLKGDLNVKGENENGGGKNEKNGENSFSGTIKDLLTKKTAMKCTAEYDLEGEKQSQTIYSDGKNMRMEVNAKIAGNENKVFVIVKDDWEYIWNESNVPGMSVPVTGMKIKFTELDKPKQSDQPAFKENGGINMERSMKFSCLPWTVNASLFDLPAGIEFDDFTNQTNNMLKNAPANACEACEMFPSAETREMCKKQNCPAGN
ncbi:MAG TPA: hypothetical protein P5080_00210 [Candidatus Paceibacterota bacterium]|nr:hypothetical protein [Candidatus Pacearchaeota archaeon]HRZ50397.1 hypothetical protein [Candidatus Paceibacterota bacterium]HSA36118.1 hypothetical protein [Candidatus Paceibacterota bacterium]